MAETPDLTIKRNDTDPIASYITEDTLAGGTVVFTMGTKTFLPEAYSGTGNGIKATGIIQILDFTFDVNDSVTLGSTEFVANDGVGGGWAAGSGTIEAARDALYVVIDASSEPVTMVKSGTDSIIVIHTSWNAVIGNAYVFNETDGITDNFTLTPATGFFDGGVTPDTLDFTLDSRNAWLQLLEIGSIIRIEHPSSIERLVVKSVNYETGEVVCDRGDNPSAYYPKSAEMWFIKVNRSAAVISGDDYNTLQYNWNASDTNKPGKFYAQWEVTKSTGRVQTYPVGDLYIVQINQDIDDG